MLAYTHTKHVHHSFYLPLSYELRRRSFYCQLQNIYESSGFESFAETKEPLEVGSQAGIALLRIAYKQRYLFTFNKVIGFTYSYSRLCLKYLDFSLFTRVQIANVSHHVMVISGRSHEQSLIYP